MTEVSSTQEPTRAAIVICPEGRGTHRKLLGLSLGERVLLALSFGGVRRVAFVGPGARPVSQRTALDVVDPATLLAGDAVIVTTADAVFDRNFVKEGVPPGVPFAKLSGAPLQSLVADPEAGLKALGMGHAESGRGFGIRVVDRASAAKAHRALLLSLRKPIDGFISRNLNRYMSLFCSSLLVRTGITPNMMTISIGVLGILAAILVGQGQPWWMLVLGAVLFQVQSVLDGCDGEIARLTYTFSDLGQWLDTVGDDITNYAFCFGLAYGQAVVLQRQDLMAFGILTLLVQIVMSIILYRRMLKLGIGDLMAIPDTVTAGGNGSGLLARILKPLREAARRDTFILIIATLTALQLPLVGFFLFALGTYPTFIAVLINERRLSAQARLAPPAA